MSIHSTKRAAKSPCFSFPDGHLSDQQREWLLTNRQVFDFQTVYKENLQYLHDNPQQMALDVVAFIQARQKDQPNESVVEGELDSLTDRQIDRAMASSLEGQREDQLAVPLSFDLLCKAVSLKKQHELSKQHEIESEYKARYLQWKTWVKEVEEQNQQEFQLRNQIINNAIQEDFAFAQANYYSRGETNATANTFVRSPNALSYSRRRGPLGDVVRSEEEMNIVLRNLMEQEKLTLGTRWMNTLASIPEMNLGDELRYLNNNNICSFEGLRAENEAEFECTNGWSREERKIFVEKYYQYPKMFGKIASFLPGRSANECVKFYYCNKKALQLKKYQKSSLALAKAALLENTLKEPAELPQEHVGKRRSDSLQGASSSLLPSHEWPTGLHDRFHEGLRLHGKNFSLISDHLDYVKNAQECKEYYRHITAQNPELVASLTQKKFKSAVATIDSTKLVIKKPQFSHYWTKEEKRRFSQAIEKYGKDWEKIASFIRTKSSNQSKKFYKKNRHLFDQVATPTPEEEEEESVPSGSGAGGKVSDEYESADEAYLFENGEFADQNSPEDLIDIDDNPQSTQVIKLPTLFL